MFVVNGVKPLLCPCYIGSLDKIKNLIIWKIYKKFMIGKHVNLVNMYMSIIPLYEYYSHYFGRVENYAEEAPRKIWEMSIKKRPLNRTTLFHTDLLRRYRKQSEHTRAVVCCWKIFRWDISTNVIVLLY